MQEIIALLPCGVVIMNAEGYIISLNPFVCSLLGYEADELIGKRLDRLLTAASRIYFQTHIYPLVMLRKAASELYVNLQTQQRTQIPILLNMVYQEQDGQSLFLLSFIPVYQRRQFEQDLIKAKCAAEDALLRNDELIRLQQELEQHQADLDRQFTHLRQRNDELEQLSKIMAHDLQEPMRKITLFADLLTQEPPEVITDLGSRALTGVATATARLRQLIGDLQFYFTLSTEVARTANIVDLTTLVRQVAEEFSPTDASVEIKALPTVPGNQHELITLFRHVMGNAVKFRKPGQTATVQVSGVVVSLNSFRHLPDKYHYANYARIVVADNGIGFGPEQRDDVFRMLRKLDPHTPGIGLGLPIARKIAERHNGQISAESTPDAGTQITILLPMA